MKKLISILFITLLCLSAGNKVKAEDPHIIFDDYASYFSASALNDLENDLVQIQNNYDIGIYIVIDKYVESPENFARSFIDAYNIKNKVVLVEGKSGYSIVAAGDKSDKINSNIDSLWNTYSNGATKFDSIRSFYQAVVRIINEDNKNTGVPIFGNSYNVTDSASLFTSDELNKLTKRLKQLSDQYGVDFVIHTAADLNGMSTQRYADDFYDLNGFSDDGIMLLIDMENRVAYIMTIGKCIAYFTDYGVESILDEMQQALKKGQYYKAANSFADTSSSYINEAIHGNVIDVGNKQKKFTWANLGLSGFVGAIVSFLTSLVLKGQMNNTVREIFAYNYVVEDSFVLKGTSDMLVDRKITRSHRHAPESSHRNHGDSGGSSTHTTSSGKSHGGHGRKF